MINIIFFVLIIIQFLFNVLCNRSSKWIHDKIDTCSFNFKQSPREKFMNNQEDPWIIYLGSPSTSIKTLGKFGPTPIPSVWSSYSNILYVHCDNSNNNYIINFQNFINNWCISKQFSKYCKRNLYLTGNYLDNNGQYILNIAISLIKQKDYKLRGLAIGYLPYKPSSIFVKQKSFEYANDLNFWTLDRASKPIQCNTHLSQIEFWMNDVRLFYKPRLINNNNNNNEMFEYELCSISTVNKCFYDLDEFSKYFNSRNNIQTDMLHPTISTLDDYNNDNKIFPKCDCSSNNKDFHQEISFLINNNVSLLVYDTIHKSHIGICSFYIGIFESDSLRYNNNNNNNNNKLLNNIINQFDLSNLEAISPSWASTDLDSNKPPGMIQSSKRNNKYINKDNKDKLYNSISSSATLTWMQFEYSGYGDVLLSIAGALDILSNLLDENNDIDFIELLVMDQVELNYQNYELIST
jgi:hypothetical protein